MNRKITGWVAVVLVTFAAESVLGMVYPTCLVEPLPLGGIGPIIVVPAEMNNQDVQTCVRTHLATHLPAEAMSKASIDIEMADRAKQKLEKFEANMALVDMRRDSDGLQSLYGVAVALGGVAGTEELSALGNGTDWAEIGRLTAVLQPDKKVVGHLQGDPMFWKRLSKWNPSALVMGPTGTRGAQVSQHFHLIRILCEKN